MKEIRNGSYVKLVDVVGLEDPELTEGMTMTVSGFPSDAVEGDPHEDLSSLIACADEKSGKVFVFNKGRVIYDRDLDTELRAKQSVGYVFKSREEWREANEEAEELDLPHKEMKERHKIADKKGRVLDSAMLMAFQPILERLLYLEGALTLAKEGDIIH